MKHETSRHVGFDGEYRNHPNSECEWDYAEWMVPALVGLFLLIVGIVMCACTCPPTLGTMNRGRGVCDVTGGLIADGCPIVLIRGTHKYRSFK